MGPKYIVLLMVFASMLGVGVANKNWPYGWNTPSPAHGNKRPTNCADTPRKILVGGSANWTFGFDYTNWALKNGPFYVNDTLVFKYDLPKDNNTHPHNVYLLPNLKSFSTCNFTKAVMVADGSQGGGSGFEFVLNKRQPYFFACGVSEGIHCNLGKMKFSVLPLIRHGRY